MKPYIIYKATAPNGKVYIGLTSQTIDERRKQHEASVHKEKRHFYYALRKYKSDMKWEIIASGIGYEWAMGMEKHYIATFNSNNEKFGYNLTIGGDGAQSPRESTRKQMSDSALKRGMTEKQIKNLDLGRVSRPHSEATKLKLKMKHKGRIITQQTRQKISDSKKGVRHSNTHNENKRIAQARPVLRSDGKPFLSARHASIYMRAVNIDAVARSMLRGGTCGGFTFQRISIDSYHTALVEWDDKLKHGHIEQIAVWTLSRTGYKHTPIARENMSRAKREREHTMEHKENRLKAISKPVHRSDGIKFRSIVDAAKAMNLTPGQVVYSIETGRPRQGYTLFWGK